MTIVSNTSPILNLTAIGEGTLLEKLYGHVFVPREVADEIKRLQASNSRFSSASLPAFVTVLTVENTHFAASLKLQLHSGEAAAIALTLEQNAKLLLDEHAARMIARRFGLATMGCLGILLEAKTRGVVPAIRPVLEKLETKAGFWVGPALRAQVLNKAGE